MIIKKLYLSGCFNYEKFIIDNISKFSISLNDSIILIRLINLYKESNEFNKEKLKENMNIRKDTFENSLAVLLEKDYYNIYLHDEAGVSHELFSIDGFFDKCEAILSMASNNSNDSLNIIMNLITESFNRILTAQEIEIIKSLVIDDLYDIEEFKIALKNLEKRNIKNIKTLSRELEIIRYPKQNKNNTPECFKDFIKNIK